VPHLPHFAICAEACSRSTRFFVPQLLQVTTFIGAIALSSSGYGFKNQARQSLLQKFGETISRFILLPLHMGGGWGRATVMRTPSPFGRGLGRGPTWLVATASLGLFVARGCFGNKSLLGVESSTAISERSRGRSSLSPLPNPLPRGEGARTQPSPRGEPIALLPRATAS